MTDERAFQVDLRGVVDLLSQHLYTSPQVYVRELMQNAVDAITARRQLEPGAPAQIAIEPLDGAGQGVLQVHDSGIGLTEPEVHELLATIGRSSKRDDFGFARHEFLGQFGIGLLACFLVADEVRVFTRSARGGPSVLWTGYSGGRYTVSLAEQQRAEPGTTVTLIPRAGAQNWLTAATVTELAGRYGGMLPFPVTVAGASVTGPGLPWQLPYPSPHERNQVLTAYAEQQFGFRPLDIIELEDRAAGLSGVAFVMPMPANPAAKAGHRVYLRRMLLSESVTKLLPDWAFFVRCVVDTTELRPTASREELYDDDLLADTRDALGAQVRDWLVRLAATDPERLQAFLAVHHLGVKALAVHDLAMLRIVDQWIHVETNQGPLTLQELRRRNPVIRYTATADEFRELAAVSGAQGINVVNGGYVYEIDIIRQLPKLDPAVQVRRLDPSELATHFEKPDPATEVRIMPMRQAAEEALDKLGCAVIVRAFDPPSLAALYLVSRQAIRANEMRTAREGANELWQEVLAAVDDFSEAPIEQPKLVLNLRSPVVARIADLPEPKLISVAVQALYGQALLQGRHPLTAQDGAMMNRSFIGLLDWAMGARGSDEGTGGAPGDWVK